MSNPLGIVIFSQEFHSQSLSNVREAAVKAGIPEELVREIKPRNAFIRAMRELKKKGVIALHGSDKLLSDKFADDDTRVCFQLSRSYVEDNGVRYDPAAIIEFNKLSHAIECSNREIKELAEKLHVQVSEIYLTTDLHMLVKRFLEDNGAKRIPLRDGVYFIPYQYKALAEQIKNFFSALNLSFFTLQASDSEKSDLISSTVHDMINTVADVKKEIEALKATGDLTQRVACNRLKELQGMLKGYTEVAHSLNERTLDLVAAAGEAGDILFSIGSSTTEQLISCIQRGTSVAPMVLDLLEAATDAAILPLHENRMIQVDIGEVTEEPAAQTAAL